MLTYLLGLKTRFSLCGLHWQTSIATSTWAGFRLELTDVPWKWLLTEMGWWFCCVMWLTQAKNINQLQRNTCIMVFRSDWSKAVLRGGFEVLCSADPRHQHHRDIGRVLPQQTSSGQLLDSVSADSSVFNHQGNILTFLSCQASQAICQY